MKLIKRKRRETPMEKPTLIEKIGNVISIAGNAILMNLLFLLASLPIVTMGQAWCGLLTQIQEVTENEETDCDPAFHRYGAFHGLLRLC